jgi:hypothetical protein
LVREALSSRRPQVVAFAAGVALIAMSVAWSGARAQAADSAGAAAVADALLWGHTMPPAEATAKLPSGVQRSLSEYRRREEEFRSGLTPPPGATPEEQAVFEQRVGIERVVFCLFPRRDSARIAALYALDVDVSLAWEGAADQPRREAAFINRLLTDLPQPWLAPYLNLIAGHRRLCAGELESASGSDGASSIRDAQRQLAVAHESGSPLIKVVAEYLATTARPCSPLP